MSQHRQFILLIIFSFLFFANLFSQEKKNYFRFHESLSPVLENAIKTENHFTIYMIFKDYFLSKDIYLKDSKAKIENDFFKPISGISKYLKLEISDADNPKITIRLKILNGKNQQMTSIVDFQGKKEIDMQSLYLSLTNLLSQIDRVNR